MSIPMVFDNVAYKVAGEYAYKGKLLITHDVIYFLPHTDLIQRRIDRTASSLSIAINSPIVGVLMWLGRIIVSTLEVRQSTDFTSAFGEGRKASLILQEKMDNHIRKLKLNSPQVTASTDLPLPLKYDLNAVKDMSISSGGVLTFDANYDTHQYNVGLLKRNILRQSLIEAGFLYSG